MDESPRKWYFAKQFLVHNNNELKIFNENICLSPTKPLTSFKAVQVLKYSMKLLLTFFHPLPLN